jgi:Protein of unknown function (DUF4239)
VNVVWALLIVAAAAAVTVTVLLLVRRGAPDGGYFNDGDRAAGVFGVLATGFAVLLGFVVFLAFEAYDEARSGAEHEALVVAQQFETAQFLPVDVRRRLSGELVCYARNVVSREWEQLEDGTGADAINPWGVALFRALKTTEPRSSSEQSAYDKWLDQAFAREEARTDRIHPADGIIPTPLWIVLFFSAATIFAFMLFFADSGERAIVQGMLIGSVTVVIVATLLLLRALDNPFHGGVGGLEPTAMERTLAVLEQARRIVGENESLPCDANGAAL